MKDSDRLLCLVIREIPIALSESHATTSAPGLLTPHRDYWPWLGLAGQRRYSTVSPVRGPKFISALLCATFSTYDFVLSSDLLLVSFCSYFLRGVRHTRRSDRLFAFSTLHKTAEYHSSICSKWFECSSHG